MAFRQSKDFVASLEKGLDVLTCFNRQNAKLTLSEVARLTGSSPASARRSLLTLHALDFLESDGRRFWLGPRVLLVAHAYLASRPTPSWPNRCSMRSRSARGSRRPWASCRMMT
ncbi:helix-turn-helix domain-containing protein [Variovorax durovernensis]